MGVMGQDTQNVFDIMVVTVRLSETCLKVQFRCSAVGKYAVNGVGVLRKHLIELSL